MSRSEQFSQGALSATPEVTLGQTEFPVTPADPHEHKYDDLGKQDGRHRTYYAGICRHCGDVQID